MLFWLDYWHQFRDKQPGLFVRVFFSPLLTRGLGLLEVVGFLVLEPFEGHVEVVQRPLVRAGLGLHPEDFGLGRLALSSQLRHSGLQGLNVSRRRPGSVRLLGVDSSQLLLAVAQLRTKLLFSLL